MCCEPQENPYDPVKPPYCAFHTARAKGSAK
jgi:hypothetical protein